MADSIILADTSILIEYFRKSDKANSNLYSLYQQGYRFCISAVTEYEIYSGASLVQIEYWNNFLRNVNVLGFNSSAVVEAVNVNNLLRRINKRIQIQDLFIAATALSNNLPIATLNKKHFDRIPGLLLVD